MKKEVILLIGSCGQIGTVLLPKLQEIYGANAVIAADVRLPETQTGMFEQLDATNLESLTAIVKKHKISQIYHMAAILSAKGEVEPTRTWDLNMQTLLNVFEAARIHQVDKVFVPSSIAVFGKSAKKYQTSQASYLDPTTVYGISKVAAENWSLYYFNRYGLDIRSLRYPGVIGYQSMPGGGTTDYTVEMYHKACLHQNYQCFLAADTTLPMIYMDDAIRATVELMEASQEKIKIRTSYNLSGMSFSPIELCKSIQQHFPQFKVEYVPDHRQKIAESWPASIDDNEAQNDWDWKPKFDLELMTKDMINHLIAKEQAMR